MYCGFYILTDCSVSHDLFDRSKLIKQHSEGVVIFGLQEDRTFDLLQSHLPLFRNRLEVIYGVYLLYLLGCTAFAIQVDQQVSNEDGIEVVFDCIDDLLGLMCVAVQLAPTRMQFLEDSK